MHHANLLVGDLDIIEGLVPYVDCDTKLDVVRITTDRLSIDDAHTLIQEAYRAPLASLYRTFVIRTNQITGDAQNALLKLFEEPPHTARFFLLLPSADELIPTLRSRFHLFISHDMVNTEDAHTDEFLRSSCAKRLTMIAMHAKNEDDSWFNIIIRDLEKYAHETTDISLKRDIVMSSVYACLYGASKRMLLEHIALSLPLRT